MRDTNNIFFQSFIFIRFYYILDTYYSDENLLMTIVKPSVIKTERKTFVWVFVCIGNQYDHCRTSYNSDSCNSFEMMIYKFYMVRTFYYVLSGNERGDSIHSQVGPNGVYPRETRGKNGKKERRSNNQR